MNGKKTTPLPEGKNLRLLALLLAILITGTLFTWWTVFQTDRGMRRSLLQQTQLVGQSISIEDHLKALSGTEADLDNLHYLRLKEQLTAVRSSDPLCRFVYLMGRKADGTIFFFVDSEPAGSKDYSPPGQIYEEVSSDLRMAVDQQSSGLAATLQPIIADSAMRTGLRQGDAESLLAVWGPVFETLHEKNNLTQFSFFDKNRICLLRVHEPRIRGGRIDRFTALQAERTGKIASGIELGPLGTFTLRAVQPVFEGGTLIGYVELGKELEDVLQTRHTWSGDQLAVIIRKESLKVVPGTGESTTRQLTQGGLVTAPLPSKHPAGSRLIRQAGSPPLRRLPPFADLSTISRPARTLNR